MCPGLRISTETPGGHLLSAHDSLPLVLICADIDDVDLF